MWVVRCGAVVGGCKPILVFSLGQAEQYQTICCIGYGISNKLLIWVIVVLHTELQSYGFLNNFLVISENLEQFIFSD